MASYRAPRIIGRISKLMFSLFIFSVCGLLIWRVFFSTKIPKEIDTMIPNAKLTEAYQAKRDQLTLQYQIPASSISRAENSYGYFSVESCVFIPEAEQVQLVFRYNNSTIRHLQADYGLPELPKKSQHLFDVTLVRMNDLTPNDHTDDEDSTKLESQRILPASDPVREETALYTFYRYVFDGVTIEDITNSIYVDVYYVEDIRYEEDPMSTLMIYAWNEEWIPYTPSKADIRAMQVS